MSFGIDDLEVCPCIFIMSEYQNSVLQLSDCEEQNSDTCSSENISLFNFSLILNYVKQIPTN